MTSPTGRTVGRTCSVTGTSLTVNFSRVVTPWFSAAEALDAVEFVVVVAVVVVVVVLAGGGVEDWPLRPVQRAPTKRRRAGVFRASFVVFGYIRSVVLVFAFGGVKHPPCHAWVAGEP
jgi:hypothetical protein